MDYTKSTFMMTTAERMGIGVVKQSYLEWLSQEDLERQAKYRQYREYYDGEQLAMLTDRQREFLELATGQEFSVNYCPLVVKQYVRRMTVDGFSVDGELGGHDGVLWKWWRKARMDSKQDDAHLSASRDGDTYVIVAWDPNKNIPLFAHNMAFDGMEGVKVHYSDETDEIIMASKRWVIKPGYEDDGIGEKRRMNLYYPDRIERYVSNDRVDGGAWKPFTEDGQDGVIDWTNAAGEPLGVPVFHLKHDAGGSRWGKSVLEDVIPIQNGLNKAFIDVIAAADTTAFRIYWATGTDMTDEDGEPISLHPGTMLTSDSAEAKFGFMAGEPLRPLIEVVDMHKITIAQVSETPLHLFQVSGQNASEGAQKQQEVAMINKAEKWAVQVGNFWEDCMQMAIKLSNTFAGTSYPEDEIIDTVWRDMEIRDKTARRKETAETAKTWTEAGADIEQAAIEAGVPEARAKSIASTAVPITDLMMQPFGGDEGGEEPESD